MLCFSKKFVMLTFDQYSGTLTPSISACTKTKWLSTLMTSSIECSCPASTELPITGLLAPEDSLWNFHDVTDAFSDQFASWREF